MLGNLLAGFNPADLDEDDLNEDEDDKPRRRR
jgi:hypothetical protein